MYYLTQFSEPDYKIKIYSDRIILIRLKSFFKRKIVFKKVSEQFYSHNSILYKRLLYFWKGDINSYATMISGKTTCQYTLSKTIEERYIFD
jgi:spore coat protein CotF